MVERADPADGLLGGQGTSNLTWPAWVEDGESRMLNLNTTGGTAYEVPALGGLVNVTQFREPGVRNAFSVVDALEWEGGRGERCEFWRELGGRLPA